MAPLLEGEVSFRILHHGVHTDKGEKLTRARTWTRLRVALAALDLLVALARDVDAAVCASGHGRGGVSKQKSTGMGGVRCRI